jgi:SAM-dependent methyltransferase
MPVVGPLAYRLAYTFSTLGKIGGVHHRTCPLCGYSGRFMAYGDPPRWDARCPSCKSVERHRLLGLLLKERPSLVSGRTIHFAPEPGVRNLIKPMAEQYQSADLKVGSDLQLNLEALDLAEASVDTFVVSHVLEHVDDRKALPELFRCLRPGGTAIIMVPIIEAWQNSYENSEVTTDEERLLHFGKTDHVRYYGADLRERIRAAGFVLGEYVAPGAASARFGLARGETVFIATRPARGAASSDPLVKTPLSDDPCGSN